MGRAYCNALSARAQWLSAHRACQKHLPEFWDCARLWRRVSFASGRHQPGKGKRGICGCNHRCGALAGIEHLYYASDYYETLYRCAEILVERGHAYVDSQSPEAIRANRGTLTEPGIASPYRTRAPEENLALLRRMRAGEFREGEHVLRAKIDMASPNLNLRDPVLYRIRYAHHY